MRKLITRDLVMVASDRLGLILALPGLTLGLVVITYVLFAKTVCDPLYQPNKLLDLDFLARINPKVEAQLRESFSPPSQEKLAFYQKPLIPRFCHEPND